MPNPNPNPISILLALVAVSAGCAPRTSAGGTAALVGGTALAIAGTALMFEMTRSEEDTDQTDDDLPEGSGCWLGGCALAGAVIAVGLGYAVAGMNAISRNAAAVEAAAPVPADDDTPEIDMRIVTPLPDVPTDPASLQFARQARSAARRGDCDTARLLVRHIADRDQRYAAALVGSPALARCR